MEPKCRSNAARQAGLPGIAGRYRDIAAPYAAARPKLGNRQHARRNRKRPDTGHTSVIARCTPMRRVPSRRQPIGPRVQHGWVGIRLPGRAPLPSSRGWGTGVRPRSWPAAGVRSCRARRVVARRRSWPLQLPYSYRPRAMPGVLHNRPEHCRRDHRESHVRSGAAEGPVAGSPVGPRRGPPRLLERQPAPTASATAPARKTMVGSPVRPAFVAA